MTKAIKIFIESAYTDSLMLSYIVEYYDEYPHLFDIKYICENGYAESIQALHDKGCNISLYMKNIAYGDNIRVIEKWRLTYNIPVEQLLPNLLDSATNDIDSMYEKARCYSHLIPNFKQYVEDIGMLNDMINCDSPYYRDIIIYLIQVWKVCLKGKTLEETHREVISFFCNVCDEYCISDRLYWLHDYSTIFAPNFVVQSFLNRYKSINDIQDIKQMDDDFYKMVERTIYYETVIPLMRNIPYRDTSIIYTW